MQNKKAFSVGEMMIVLLIISITLAASMPILTKRSKSSVDNSWHPAQNNADVYFNTGKNNGIIIGETSFPLSSKARLMLNLANDSDSDTSHLIFTKNNALGAIDVLAKIRITNNQLEFGSGSGATGDNATTFGISSSAGDNATAIGSNTNANAENSTVIGYKATSNSNGIAVGKESNAGSNGVAIGSAVQAGSNSVAIGSSSTQASSSGSVAIGTNAKANGDYNIALGYGTTAGGNTSASYSVAIGPNVITDGNNLMNIGTVKGETGINTINIGTAGTVINFAGYNAIDSSGTWVYVSDIRKKNIIGEFKSGLDDIMKIKTYEFTYKDDLNKNKRVGVIAQELQKIFPDAVKTDKKGYLSIRKEDIFFAIVNAVKELNLKCIELEKENKQLKKEIENLSERIDKLEQSK